MKTKLRVAFIAWRFYLIVAVILLIVAGLIGRMIDLTIVKRQFLQNQGDLRAIRVVNQPAFRGMITDRNGSPLAISTSVYSIWVNPEEFSPTPNSLKILSDLLTIKPSVVETLVQEYEDKNREFVYLKRGVAPQIAAKIKSLGIEGVYLHQEYKRFYPEAEVTSHVVGFTDVDDQGKEGLELAYNQWLAGTAGKKLVMKDRRGQTVTNMKTMQEQKPGNDLVLSIDKSLQYLAYRELLAGVQENIARSGSVVILDVQTGEILAMVNQPAFNPNNRAGKKTDSFRNRAVTDVFEPGSTIKAFSIASALDSGRFKPDTIIDTYPGWIRVGHNIVRDEHSKGPMTVTKILQISSNVGVSKMILSLPPDQLYDVLHRVGFGEITALNFPGERSGTLIKRATWQPFTLATMSFGYGLSVTALQLAAAYAVIADGGIKLPASLLKLDQPPVGKRVMNEKIANDMLQLLEAVVTKGGTGELANVPGYRIAGKTGTAIIAGENGYKKDAQGRHYESSFVGIAPASHPRLVVAVVIHDPKGKKYYGGEVSGPVFEKIMEGALRILNIPPDKTTPAHAAI